jgi:hypothetical protein
VVQGPPQRGACPLRGRLPCRCRALCADAAALPQIVEGCARTCTIGCIAGWLTRCRASVGGSPASQLAAHPERGAALCLCPFFARFFRCCWKSSFVAYAPRVEDCQPPDHLGTACAVVFHGGDARQATQQHYACTIFPFLSPLDEYFSVHVIVFFVWLWG